MTVIKSRDKHNNLIEFLDSNDNKSRYKVNAPIKQTVTAPLSVKDLLAVV